MNHSADTGAGREAAPPLNSFRAGRGGRDAGHGLNGERLAPGERTAEVKRRRPGGSSAGPPRRSPTTAPRRPRSAGPCGLRRSVRSVRAPLRRRLPLCGAPSRASPACPERCAPAGRAENGKKNPNKEKKTQKNKQTKPTLFFLKPQKALSRLPVSTSRSCLLKVCNTKYRRRCAPGARAAGKKRKSGGGGKENEGEEACAVPSPPGGSGGERCAPRLFRARRAQPRTPGAPAGRLRGPSAAGPGLGRGEPNPRHLRTAPELKNDLSLHNFGGNLAA